MKKLTKAFLSLALCLCLVLSAGLTACGGNNGNNGGNESHKCEHVCTECGKCLTECEELECADKCQGHTPPHECEDVCPECHKCLTECEEPECADKCQGHTPPHECEDVCSGCHKCLTECEEPECADKCQGHTPPHACEHVCPECHKCLTDCKEPECEEKCEGHVVSTPISVAADSTADMPISGIEAGLHIIEADLGSTMLDTGRLQAYIGEGTKSELVYSETRSTEGHNVYFGYIKIAEGDTAITFTTQVTVEPTKQYTAEAVTATVVIKDYEMPTLKADGVAVEIPLNIKDTASEDYLKILIDSTVTNGSYVYTISCSCSTSITKLGSNVFFGTQKSSTSPISKWGIEQSITISGLQEDSTNYCYMLGASNTYDYLFLYPFTISLKPAV